MRACPFGHGRARWLGCAIRRPVVPLHRRQDHHRPDFRIARWRDPGVHSATAPRPPTAPGAPAHGAKARAADAARPPS